MVFQITPYIFVKTLGQVKSETLRNTIPQLLNKAIRINSSKTYFNKVN